jgi:hypothetical protein
MNLDHSAIAQFPKSSQFSISPTIQEQGYDAMLVVVEPGADVEYTGIVSVGGNSMY